jgi:transposase
VRFLRRAEKELKKAQRELSRKQKGSKNREKARLKVARAHAHIADARREFHPGSCRPAGLARTAAMWMALNPSTSGNGPAPLAEPSWTGTSTPHAT